MSRHLARIFTVFSALLLALAVTPNVFAQTTDCAQTYVVQQGDWLSTIAQRFYNDPKAYTLIFDATNTAAKTDTSFATLADVNRIVPGQKLCIPSSSQIPGREAAGVYTNVGPAADASALVETIVLGPDGQARNTLDYIGKAQIDAKGTWTQSGNTVTVVLNEQGGQPTNQTTTYTVTDGNLVGTNAPNTVYTKTAPEIVGLSGLYTTNRSTQDGSQTLTSLTLLPNGVAQMTITAGTDFIMQTGTWTAGTNADTGAPSVTVNLTDQNGQAINETYVFQVQGDNLRGTQYDTNKWGTDLTFTKYQPPAQPETPATAMMQDAAGSYASEMLPAADAPGRFIVLNLAGDGKAEMTTQFVGKGEPIIDAGTWVLDSGNYAVTLTDSGGTSQTLVFAPQNGTLVLQDSEAAGYGSAGLTLTKTPSGQTVSASFGGVTIGFDQQLAQSAAGANFPAVPVTEGPALGGATPAGIRFLFNGATVEDFFSPTQAQVLIYKTEDWVNLDPTTAKSVADLTAILKDKPTTFPNGIPVLPPIAATQVFQVKPRYHEFPNSTGIGFLTTYAQDVSPILASQLFYTYQELSQDGKYYIAVFYPVTTPYLPTDPTAALGGATYDEWAKNYETYLQTVVKDLNGLIPAAFDPNLELLDGLVDNIEVGPTTLE